MLTLNEIQFRFENALISLTGDSFETKMIPEEILLLARSFKQRSRMSTVQVKSDDLVIALLNLLVIAAELGINLENKITNLLSQVEGPSFFIS